MATQETPGEMLARLREAEEAKEAETKAMFAKLNAETEAKRAAADKAAAETAQAKEAERQAAADAEFNRRFKTPALDAWIAMGGSTADFEKHWREEAPKVRMAESQRQADAARGSMLHLYRDL
jgi:hypothetical protein